MKRLICVIAAASVLLAGCGSSDDKSADTKEPAGAVIHVPGDYGSIQEAVRKAKQGDLVLVDKGVYKEEVNVETPGITVRGVDRNETILDGEFQRENGIKVFSNNVAVENMTARNYKANGFFFTGDYSKESGSDKVLDGFRLSYLTAYNNGLYGLYVFNAKNGVIEHSYGSGHPDSAVYIGQCDPCNALITDIKAEYNMLGYSGTNSTGVTIINSTFQNNRAGIVPNSLHGEAHAPNNGTHIVGNKVFNNNSDVAPKSPSASDFNIAYGNGIVLAGVSHNVVERNLVTGHKGAGIAITDLPEKFKPEGNQVKNNTLSQNVYDLAYLIANFSSMSFQNCFEGNKIATEIPAGLQEKGKCGGAETDLGDASNIKLPEAPPEQDWKTRPIPPPQPNMPDATTAPATKVGPPESVDTDAIQTPSA